MNIQHPFEIPWQPPATHVLAVFALELSPGAPPPAAALAQADAARLAALVGRDLAALVPGLAGLDLCLAAAHFDPAEVLRPGWPLHRRLDELHARAPKTADGGARLIAFGADADGQVPLPFQADPALAGGQLRVLPLLLRGEESLVREVSAQCEEVLIDRGMAQADTALCAQEAFAARIEHARYLTAHDLAAMTALQYEHQGLDKLWPLIETALLSPQATIDLDAPPEPLLRYADGEVRIALLSPAAWRSRNAPEATEADADRLRRLLAGYEARQRQYAAVLQAHGIEVVFAECGGDARQL